MREDRALTLKFYRNDTTAALSNQNYGIKIKEHTTREKSITRTRKTFRLCSKGKMFLTRKNEL